MKSHRINYRRVNHRRIINSPVVAGLMGALLLSPVILAGCNTVEEKPAKSSITLQQALRTDDSSVCHAQLQKVASRLLGVKAHLSEEVFMTLPTLTLSNAPDEVGDEVAKTKADIYRFRLQLTTPGEGLCVLATEKGNSGSVPYCECRGI